MRELNKNTGKPRTPFLILLVIFAILLTYYVSIFGEVCRVDDIAMRDHLETDGAVPLYDYLKALVPQAEGGAYYRPVIALSYYFDAVIWKLDPSFMKIENILLHALNAVLVYWLAFQLLPGNKDRQNSLLPLISALLFGLHPVNTESVNWISGRTDLLACLFILLAANFTLVFKRTGRLFPLGMTVVAMVLAFLTKEVSLAFIPGALLMLNAKNQDGEPSVATTEISTQKIMVFTAAAVSGAIVFFLLRHAAFTSNSPKIGFTLRVFFSDIYNSSFVVLNAFAFYVKKTFFPFPLNFGIIEVDPLYDFVGVPLVVFCMYLLSKRNLLSSFFLAGIFLITPAFLIAFKQIAWTPYAERYVYMASAFIMIAAVFSCSYSIDDAAEKLKVSKTMVAILLLIAAFAGTCHRNITWTRNVTLFQDMAEQSPNFSLARTLYGFSLAENGELEKARVQFELANIREGNRKSFEKTSEEIEDVFGYFEDADLGLAYILEREQRLDEAAGAYERILKKKKGKSGKVLERLVALNIYQLTHDRSVGRRLLARNRLLQYADKKYQFEDAPALYLIGKVLLLRNDLPGAKIFLTRAKDCFEKSCDYQRITQKLLLRIDRDYDFHKDAASPSLG